MRVVEHALFVWHIPVDHITQWTDGCAAQYKVKGPFADISPRAAKDFNCILDSNFFGSWHANSPSDGESAVIKSGAARAIRSGKAVAEDLFAFC